MMCVQHRPDAQHRCELRARNRARNGTFSTFVPRCNDIDPMRMHVPMRASMKHAVAHNDVRTTPPDATHRLPHVSSARWQEQADAAAAEAVAVHGHTLGAARALHTPRAPALTAPLTTHRPGSLASAVHEEDGWVRHSEYGADDYHVENCKALAAAWGFPDMCVTTSVKWGVSKAYAAAYCCDEHDVNAPQHGAWGNTELMQAIWADPSCYRHRPGRRKAATGTSTNVLRGPPSGKGADRGGKGSGRGASGDAGGAHGRGKGATKGGGSPGSGKGKGRFRGQVARY